MSHDSSVGSVRDLVEHNRVSGLVVDRRMKLFFIMSLASMGSNQPPIKQLTF